VKEGGRCGEGGREGRSLELWRKEPLWVLGAELQDSTSFLYMLPVSVHTCDLLMRPVSDYSYSRRR
jgi:hypothetical protein